MVSDVERKIIEAYCTKNGYADLDAWARDSDYLHTECCGWVDLEDTPVDIVSCFFGAIESSGELEELIQS